MVASQPQLNPQLIPVGEKLLPAKCKPSSLAYCPTMDLIALTTEAEEFCAFRLNGQRVFGGSFKNEDLYFDDKNEDEDGGDDGGEIRKLVWKNDGECLLCRSTISSLY